MSGNRYVLDTNVFVQAHNLHYRFDVVPGFWRFLETNKSVCSIDRVYKELMGHDDELSNWAKSKVPDEFFKDTKVQTVIGRFRDIQEWVESQSQFFDAAKSEFAAGADGWLVAFAEANELVLVTGEKYEKDVKKRVKIPNVCRQFGVEYCNTFDMLRRLQARFDLTP